MANVAVVGIQWGDEGKGKIVDWLSSRADVVVRFQGGHNAGHTLTINGVEYKLSLLPSGIVRPGKLSIIGNGVVVDPWALLAEIEKIAARGVEITPKNLIVAENATLILPVHSAVDKAREAAKGAAKIGTTGRGIGPAYEDKIARRAIRVCDLADPDVLREKARELLVHHNALLRGFNAPEMNADELVRQLLDVAPKILPYAGVTWQLLDKLRREGQTHSVRRGAGGDARCRSRHLSVCHLVQYRCRAGLGGIGCWIIRRWLCPWHLQGVHYARWLRPVSDRRSWRGGRVSGR